MKEKAYDFYSPISVPSWDNAGNSFVDEKMIEKTHVVGQGFDKNCEYLLEKQAGISALIKYGSKVYGKAVSSSQDDFFTIVEDLNQFHKHNVESYKEDYHGVRLMMRMPIAHMIWHKLGPNYYAVIDGNHNIKEAVIGLNSFIRACERGSMYVAGRMQKPVNFAYFSDEGVEHKVKEAVGKARKKGLELAVSLCKTHFGFYDFAEKLVGLSYKADFRLGFEAEGKVQELLDDSFLDLREIYEPLLEGSELVDRKGNVYSVRMNGNGRIIKQAKTEAYLWLNKIPVTITNVKHWFTNAKSRELLEHKSRRNKEKKQLKP